MKVSRLIQRSRARRSCRVWPVGGATVGRARKRFSSSDGWLQKLQPHCFHVLFGVLSNMGTQMQNFSVRGFDSWKDNRSVSGLAGWTT